MRNFTGRKEYLGKLNKIWASHKTKLVSLYGRRRVGKTAIIKRFAEGKRVFLFEAIENTDTQGQVKHFLEQLSSLTGKAHIRDLAYKDWPPVFDLFTEIILQEKSVVVAFDELPWMAAGRTKLVSYIKFYWDKHWKNHPHILFILCGSVASWMIKNVVRSTALYGRISENILVNPLKPHEVAEYIGKKRGRREILEYYLCFGGIPKYLEEFDFNRSIQLNIENTCFQPSGFFVEEADKIFYNQFRETGIYKKIVQHLFQSQEYLHGISKKVRISSGGGLKLYLDNLMATGIIDKKEEIKNFKVTKTHTYFVADEFLRFHHQFIKPNLSEIRLSTMANKFEKLTQNKWHIFLGQAFERFCLKERYIIAELVGFGHKIMAAGSVCNAAMDGFQFDLVFIRKDSVITLCEVKYLSEPPSTKLIREFENKITRTKFPKEVTLEKMLISNQPPSDALAESGYFHHILLADEIVRSQ